MRAADILDVLEAKHGSDLYAREVSCGPQGSARLDAWAMPRSWARWQTLGYEVKVSRQDWTQDQKLEGYRAYVHRLYVVCPWGLIQPDEMTEGVGLLWVTKTGSRAITKRKAAKGEPASWEEPMLSVLINRGVIRSDRLFSTPKDTRKAARDYLAGKIDDQRLGWELGSKLSAKMRELDTLRRQVERFESYWQRMSEAGYATVEDAVRTLETGLCQQDRGLHRAALRAADALEMRAKELRDLAGRPPEGGSHA